MQTSAAPRLVRFVLDRSLLLVAGAIVALVWANTSPASYSRFAHAVHFPVNDVAMVFFFAMAAKEIVEATLPGGELASPRAAAVPLLAAAAGMFVPAAVYFGGAHAIGHPELSRGWAIPCATDIAFSYLVARLVFPPGHAALPFLLLLAVADDALGLLVLAIFYPAGPVSPLLFAVFMIPALAMAWALRRTGVGRVWPYVFGAGTLSWLAFHLGGLHPALALVPIVPFMRAESRYHDLFERTAPGHDETLSVFAARARVPVEIILFFFGLANAGVPIGSVGPATWLVSGALLLGKPFGILLMTVIAVRLGLARPAGMTYGDVLIVGVAAGIGFTVALFFATAAFPPGDALDAAKMGALLSFIAAPAAVVLGRLAGSSDRGRRPARA